MFYRTCYFNKRKPQEVDLYLIHHVNDNHFELMVTDSWREKMVTAMADPDRYRDQFMKNTSDKSTTPNTPPQPSLLSRSILSSSRVSHSQKLFSFPDSELLQGQGTQLHQNPHSLALKETMDPMGRVKADMAMALQHSRYKLGSVA